MTAAVGARNLFKVDAGVVHALLQARYYDGSKGEFLSEDPVFWSAQQNLADPQSLNSYSYANDNPINRSDPDGRAASLSGLISSLKSLATSLQSLISSFRGGGGGSSAGSASSPSTNKSGVSVSNVLPNSAWVSQFSLPKPDEACLRACDAMGSPNSGLDSSMVTGKLVEGKVVTQPGAKQGLDTINSYLLQGKPIAVGVNMNGGTGDNANPATQHFVKVVGAGVDQKGQYYNFFDPGTHYQDKGTSPQNRLYVNPDYSLSGTSVYNQNTANYVVTEVRP
jgi:RHS repeat-associated protein